MRRVASSFSVAVRCRSCKKHIVAVQQYNLCFSCYAKEFSTLKKWCLEKGRKKKKHLAKKKGIVPAPKKKVKKKVSVPMERDSNGRFIGAKDSNDPNPPQRS